MMQDWSPQTDHCQIMSVHVGRCELKPGDQVRLRPAARADIFDLVLDGQIATIEAMEQDFEGHIYLAVTVDNDPGNDLGALRMAGHRFFFKPEEVDPLVCVGSEP